MIFTESHIERDSLLPMLLSGEIRVADANKLVETTL